MAFDQISDEYLTITKKKIIKEVVSILITLVLSVDLSCALCYIFLGVKYFVYTATFGVIIVLLISIHKKWFLIFDKTWCGVIVGKRKMKTKKLPFIIM